MNFGPILTKLLKAAKLCELAQQYRMPFDAVFPAVPGAAGHAGPSHERAGGAAQRQWRVADTAWSGVR